MKRQTSFFSFRAFVISVGLITFTSAAFTVDVPKETRKEQVAGEIKSEKQLYNNALRMIRKTAKRARTSGTPYRISCQYKIKDNKPVSASTEVHYADYRKKSDSQSVDFVPVDGKLDRVVEFVYKPNSGTLAIFDRDPEKLSKRLATSKVNKIKIDI